MSFLNQLMLAGLAAAAIPIIIHLLNRRRFRRVRWAAMRFVQVSLQRNQRRMQLEDLILLATRCLLLVLLALALARPAVDWLRASVLGGSKVSTALVVDRSASMGAGGRFELARRAGEQVLDALPAGSAAAVLLASDAVDAGIVEPTLDLRLAREVLGEARLSDRPTDLLPAVEKALEVLGRDSAVDKELVVVTDGQAAGWADFEALVKRLAEAENIRASIVLVGEQGGAPQNLGVSDLRQVSALTPAGQALRFEVEVTNFGSADADSVPVSLEVDGEPAGEPFVIESLAAGATEGVTLFASLGSPGYHRVTASLPGDAMPADDRRTIALRAADGVRVLLVDGEPGRVASEAETFFVRNALVPVAAEDAAEFFIEARSVGVADLVPGVFAGHTAVVLANVAELPDAVVSELVEFVERGGGLIVFPGANTNAANFSSALRDVLPVAFGEQIGGPLSLQASGYDHSVVELWDDPGSGSLSDAVFLRAHVLEPRDGARTVLRFNDGGAALVEGDRGLGKVFVFASTADTEWNNLPVRPAFVPLLHRLLGAVVGNHEAGLNLAAGHPIDYRLAPEFAGSEVVVTTADGRSSSVRLGGDARLRLDQTDRAGAYRAAIARPPATLMFGVQPDPRESRLAVLTEQQRERLAQHAALLEFGAGSDLRAAVGSGRSGAELWLVLIVATLAVGVAEMVLAHLFSREK